MASTLRSEDEKVHLGKNCEVADVASFFHCTFIPLLSDEVVAKVQSLESYYGVQISFTEKHVSILELFQAISEIGRDITTSKISGFCSTCGNKAIAGYPSFVTPTWFCTDLSKIGCAPFQLSPADSEALEKHFLYGGISVNLSGEGYFINFKEMKLNSTSGKAASLHRCPSFDGTPQQKVKMRIQGNLKKSEEVQEAVAKVFEEGYVKASPIEISSPLIDSQEFIKNIVRQYCVNYEFTLGENDSFTSCPVLLLTGAPGYIDTVHKRVRDQLVVLKTLLNGSNVSCSREVILPNQSVLSSSSQFSKFSVLPMFSSGSSSASLSSSSSSPVAASPGSSQGSPLKPATSPNVLVMPNRSPPSTVLSPPYPIPSPVATSPGSSRGSPLKPDASPNVLMPNRSLPSTVLSPPYAIPSAAPLTLGALSHSNFNPVCGVTKLASNPITIPSSSVRPPSPQRSPTLKPTFIDSGQVPPLWEAQSEKCVFCKVQAGSEEWKAVHKLAAKTLPSITLEKVERVQNMVLWEKYSLEGKHMNERNSGQINERYLFHGTSKVDPHEVARADSGVDFRYSMTNRKSLMWGTGAYFAVNLSYSDYYSYKCSGNRRQVMVVSVMTGFSYSFGTAQSRELTKPPVCPLAKESRLYDTVNGETTGSLVYVVYDHCKTCPAYIITYTKR